MGFLQDQLLVAKILQQAVAGTLRVGNIVENPLVLCMLVRYIMEVASYDNECVLMKIFPISPSYNL